MHTINALHLLVVASDRWERRIRETWGSARNGTRPHYASPADLEPPPGPWTLAIVEYARGDARCASSPFFRLCSSHPDLPVVAVIAEDEADVEETIVEALRAGAVDCVSTARVGRLSAIVQHTYAYPSPPSSPALRLYPVKCPFTMSPAMPSEALPEGLLQLLLEENRNQRALLDAVFSASPIGMAVVRAADHVYELANAAYRAIPGTPDTPLVGRAFEEVLPEATAMGVPAMIDEAAATGRTVSLREYRVPAAPERDETYWDVDQIPLLEADGSSERVLIIATDVTARVLQRHELEARAAELAEERALLRTIIDNAPEGIVVADREGRVTLTNAAADRIYARPVPYGEEYATHARMGVCYPDGRPVSPRDLPLTRSALDGVTLRDIELAIHWPDGQYRALLVNSAPIHRATGEVDGAVGVFQDITERKRAEEALASIARFPDENPDPVLRVTREGTILYANPPAAQVLSAWGCHVGGRVPEAWHALVTAALRDKSPQVLDLEAGSSTYSLSIVPIADGDYANVYGQDVTAERQAEAAARTAGEHLALDLATMTRLQALSTRLVQPDDLMTLLHEILSAAADLTGTGRGNLQFLDEETDQLRIAVQQGLSDAYIAHFATRGCAAACARAQRTRRRVIIEDIRQEPLLRGTPDLAVFEAEGVRSITSTPLLGRDGRLLGVMSNHYALPRRTEGHELQRIDLLARMAADVIERSRAEEALRASEARLREVLENSRDAIYRLDLTTGRYVYCSPAIEALTGYLPEEWVGRSGREFQELIHPYDRDTFRAHSRALTTSNEESPADGVEYRLKTKHAGYRWVHASRRLVRDVDGKPVAIVGATRDIEEQKRADLAMARRLEELAILADASQVLSREASQARIIARACELGVERFGLRLAWIGLVPEDGSSTIRPVYAAGHDEGYVRHLTISMDDRAERRPVSEALRGGQTVVVRDIATDPRVQAEWRAEALARGLRTVVVLPLMHDGRSLGVLTAYSDAVNAFDDERLQALQALASLAAAGLEKARLHEQVRRHAEDLEQQVAARTAALVESEARFRAVFEDSALGIALLDGQGRLLAVNPVLADLFGRAAGDLLGHPYTDCLAPGLDKEQWLRWYLDLVSGCESTGRGELRWQRPDGQLRLGEVTISVVREKQGASRLAIAMLEDVTEERQARAALIQSERLNVTGQLTAAFAHEVKNPLQAVIGCLGLLDETLATTEMPDKARRYLQVARDELYRADRVVNRLREFHRHDDRPEEPTSLRDLLEQVILVTQRQCENQFVETEFDVPADLPRVTVRRDEMQQVFLNLILNAIDAMPQGGVLRVRAAPTADPAGVRVSFTDSGMGISKEAMPHMFQFLYTTKKQGTGLGLFVCQEIVRNHGGEIMVESTEGAGTTFTVWLRE